MRPCDCLDTQDVKKLKEQGLSYNGRAITVAPLVVILQIDCCTIRIPQRLFKSFAQWYLEDQDE